MKPRVARLLLGMLLFFATAGVAQQAPPVRLKAYTSALDNLRELKPVEKLYLQTDKPHYNLGDTLRFKAYLLTGDYLTASKMSGLLYVELDNEQGKRSKQIMVPVVMGLAAGDIALDSLDIPAGNYTLRAYTNWMRNFGDDRIFKKSISIAQSSNNPLLAKAAFKQNGDKVESTLQFNYMDGKPLGFKNVELKLMNGRKNLSKDKLITGSDGGLAFNFNVPDGAGSLSIQAVLPGGNTMNIPVVMNGKENTDLQFMPEGGQLIAGLSSRVGFKAIGDDGKSVAVSGNVIDSKGKQVAAFTSAYAGMGSFEFTPVAGEVYLARVNGIAKNYALPVVSNEGTVLAVKPLGTDSLQITVSVTPAAKGAFELIGQVNGLVCFGRHLNVDESLKVSVSKSIFPTGIIRFSLLNTNNEPLNERIVFINHHDQIRIAVEPVNNSYGIRDSIALAIKATDKDGVPLRGSFSLSVTDNGQVRPDSLGSNLLNYLLLTSDLKGNIETPGYYFADNKESELDYLMLTQGWVGYSWQEAFHPKLPFAYKPQTEFLVSGKVTTAFGGAIERSNVVLFANNPITIKDTLTDNAGRFVFKGLFPVDTALFKLQARNKKGKEMNVKVEMDELDMPVFTPAPFTTPWYLNTDTIILNNSRTKVEEAIALSDFRGEGNVLNEVNIKAKKIIAGTKNLNGPGEADLIIDEEELKKADKKTLLDLLQEKVVGFGLNGFTPPRREYGPSLQRPDHLQRDLSLLTSLDREQALKAINANLHKPWRQSYMLRNQEVHFIIDGIDLDKFYNDVMEVPPYDTKRYYFIKPYLEYFSAEDITGIEVMLSNKYTAAYSVDFETYKERAVAGRNNAFAYIEITTRAKKGPYMDITPGTYLYKTLPFSLAKQFYSPKYTVKNKTTAPGTDLRSTIFWEPNIITDENGKAIVSFYSADKPGTYTITIEGTDMDGQLGSSKYQLKIR